MESPDAWWGRVGYKVIRELDRRLDDPQDAKSLPGTLLMRLVEQYLKYEEKRLAALETEEAEFLTPLEAIDQEGLPNETKVEILQTYINQLAEDHAKAEEKLKELLSGDPQAV